MASRDTWDRNTHLQNWGNIKERPHGQGLVGSSFAAPKSAHSCLIYLHLTSQLPCAILGTPETPELAALSHSFRAQLTSGALAFVGTKKCLTSASQTSQLSEGSFVP